MKTSTKVIKSKNCLGCLSQAKNSPPSSKKVLGKELQVFSVGSSWVSSASMGTVWVRWIWQGYWQHLLLHTKMTNTSLYKTSIFILMRSFSISLLECVFETPNPIKPSSIIFSDHRSPLYFLPFLKAISLVLMVSTWVSQLLLSLITQAWWCHRFTASASGQGSQ